MARRRRNLTEDEIKAIAMQRAEAAYQAAVARGMARFAREQARQEKQRQAARGRKEA